MKQIIFLLLYLILFLMFKLGCKTIDTTKPIYIYVHDSIFVYKTDTIFSIQVDSIPYYIYDSFPYYIYETIYKDRFVGENALIFYSDTIHNVEAIFDSITGIPKLIIK